MTKPPGALRLEPHSPKALKRFPWLVCSGCGLVYLRNEATRKALRSGHWVFADEKGS